MADIDEIENSYEGTTTANNNNNGDDSNGNDNHNNEEGVTALISDFLKSAPRIVMDDVVSVKPDCPEKFAWLRNHVGIVVKVTDARQIIANAGVDMQPEQINNLMDFAIVQFNLLNADMSFDELPDEDEDEENNNNAAAASSSSTKLKNKDKMGIPSAVVNVAVPADVLDIRDRGISALDVVLHTPTKQIGNVGGFSLKCSVMPVEMPKQVAALLRQAAAASGENQQQQQQEPLFDETGPDATPVREHPVVKRNVRDLHCAQLLPTNPFRRTVAVVDKATLRIGFVDQVNSAAVILLDNGSIAIAGKAHDIEDQLLLEVSISREGRRRHRQRHQKHHQQHHGGGKKSSSSRQNDDGDDEDEEENFEEDEEDAEWDSDDDEEDEEKDKDSLDDILEDGSDQLDRDAHAIIDEEERDSDVLQSAMMSAFRERNMEAIRNGSFSVAEQRERIVSALEYARQMLPEGSSTAMEQQEDVAALMAALGLPPQSGAASPSSPSSPASSTQAPQSATTSNAASLEAAFTATDPLDEFDAELGPMYDSALPNWAYSKPVLSWFRRVRVPHRLVKKGRIIMAMGQPDYDADENLHSQHYKDMTVEQRIHFGINDLKKNSSSSSSSKNKKNKRFDMGTVICMSPETVDVRWCVNHFDPHSDPPPSELEPDVDVRKLFVVQHFYSELMGIDALQDTAFVRKRAVAAVSGDDAADDDDDDDDSCPLEEAGNRSFSEAWAKAQESYQQLHDERLRQLVEEEKEKKKKQQEQTLAAAAPLSSVNSGAADDDDGPAEPPLLYNVQEVETATSTLNCKELNTFYKHLIFPQTVEEARHSLSSGSSSKKKMTRNKKGAHHLHHQHDGAAPMTLLQNERWQHFFGNLSKLLTTVVRIVDVESFHCVTLSSGEKLSRVPAFDMLRMDQTSTTAFDHITAFPREVVYKSTHNLSEEEVRQQQLAEDAVSSVLPKVTLMKDDDHKKQQQQQQSSSSAAAKQQKSSGALSSPKSNDTAATRHLRHVVIDNLEQCALFDVVRCIHPDLDCVVSDIVTLRTRDDQAQILSVAGLPPSEIGLVRSVDPSEMTAKVAWGHWEDGSDDEDDNNNNNQNSSSNNNSDKRSIFLKRVDRYPRFSRACDRLSVAAAAAKRFWARHNKDSNGEHGKNVTDNFFDDEFARTFDAAGSPFAHDAGQPDFMVGQVMGKVSLNEVIVRWWNGAVEHIAPSRLLVHHFPYEDDDMLDEDEEYEEMEDEEEEEDTTTQQQSAAATLQNQLANVTSPTDLLRVLTGQAAREHSLAENPFVDDNDNNNGGSAFASAASAAPTRLAGGGSNMKRIPSDTATDQNALEKFLNDVHTPTEPSPPASPEKSRSKNDGDDDEAQPPLPGDGDAAAAAAAGTTQQQQQQQDGVLGRVVGATKSVGNFFYSLLGSGASGSTDNVAAAAAAVGQNTHADPSAGVAAAAASASSSGPASSAASSSATPPATPSLKASSGIPATTVPGTFTACTRFAAHLVDDASADFTPAQPNVFLKRVMNELKSLRNSANDSSNSNNMPDIFVKSNEDRMHTLKFCILGGVHTPYYQGFYCFDLALPTTFPNQPPDVRFHARNMRLNPNLYEDGKVCLSLLGTWAGQAQHESWSVTSTLRQVMISIQAIILCQQPYFNEPGNEQLQGTREGGMHSRMYNEQAFLLKIAHLMHEAQQPPPDWAVEFREHYLRVVPRMLARWKRYLEITPSSPGSPAAGAINADGLILPMSGGLRQSLAKRMEQLQAQYDVLSARWKAEMEAFEFHGGDDDDDDDE